MSANGGLIHPLSGVRRWRAATQSNGKCPQDLKREAAAAWRRSGCATTMPTPLRQGSGCRAVHLV
jgi:hypothetical protein